MYNMLDVGFETLRPELSHCMIPSPALLREHLKLQFIGKESSFKGKGDG